MAERDDYRVDRRCVFAAEYVDTGAAGVEDQAVGGASVRVGAGRLDHELEFTFMLVLGPPDDLADART